MTNSPRSVLQTTLILVGVVAGTILMLLGWLIPVWPYDWIPPSGAQKDADLTYFDLLCVSASILVMGATALLNFRTGAGTFRAVTFAILTAATALAIARLASLLFNGRPWPDFR